MIRNAKHGRCTRCRKVIPKTRAGSFFCTHLCGSLTAEAVLGRASGENCRRCGQYCFAGINEATAADEEGGPAWCYDCHKGTPTP